MKIKLNLEITAEGKKPETCSIEVNTSKNFGEYFNMEGAARAAMDFAHMKSQQMREDDLRQEFAYRGPLGEP